MVNFVHSFKKKDSCSKKGCSEKGVVFLQQIVSTKEGSSMVSGFFCREHSEERQ